jgi:zinc D-Ala-D-Ala dipeptidase
VNLFSGLLSSRSGQSFFLFWALVAHLALAHLIADPPKDGEYPAGKEKVPGCVAQTAALVQDLSPLDFLNVRDVASDIIVELPYATTKNFTNKQVYPTGSRAFLRRPVAVALAAVQRELKEQGLGLKVWDAYRPFSIQEQFWLVVPNPNYVKQPVRNGPTLVEGSVHNRGGAVDLTLVDAHGKELEMPTEFDDFSARAHRNYQGANGTALANRHTLETVMHKHGFVGLPTEWWHFDWNDSNAFPLSDEPIEALGKK